MADTSTQTVQIAAAAKRVIEIVTDLRSYPSWVEAIKEVEVLSEYEDGYAHEVRFVIDAGMAADTYTLVYEYAEDLSRVQWRLAAPSKLQKRHEGAYDIVDNGDGTTSVTYSLKIELASPMMRMFQAQAERKILDAALRELKRRAEAPA